MYDNQNKYLNKVVDILVKQSKVIPSLEVIMYPTTNHYNSITSLYLPSTSLLNTLSKYTYDHYGLTEEEFKYVWEKYNEKMLSLLGKSKIN